MKESEAIKRMRYRIDTATDIAGKGVDGKAYEDMEMAIKDLKEIQQYRAIGTVEECRGAVERQKAKKPLPALENQKKAGYRHKCPKCGCAAGYVEKKPFRKRVLIEQAASYCCICGQKLDWSE